MALLRSIFLQIRFLGPRRLHQFRERLCGDVVWLCAQRKYNILNCFITWIFIPKHSPKCHYYHKEISQLTDFKINGVCLIITREDFALSNLIETKFSKYEIEKLVLIIRNRGRFNSIIVSNYRTINSYDFHILDIVAVINPD